MALVRSVYRPPSTVHRIGGGGDARGRQEGVRTGWEGSGHARDLRDEPEETALSVCADAPVHGHQLIAVAVIRARARAARAGARVEVAPGGPLRHRHGEIVGRLLEVEMVILVEYDR